MNITNLVITISLIAPLHNDQLSEECKKQTEFAFNQKLNKTEGVSMEDVNSFADEAISIYSVCIQKQDEEYKRKERLFKKISAALYHTRIKLG